MALKRSTSDHEQTSRSDEMPANAATAREVMTALGTDERPLLSNRDRITIETPPSLLDGAVTPIERFFIRNRQPVPIIAPEAWQLHIDGLVRRPLIIDYADLRAMPLSSYYAVLSGHSVAQAPFYPGEAPNSNLDYGMGMIGNAEWIGVPVALLFEHVGIKRSAFKAICISAGSTPLIREIAPAKLFEDAMLAFAMNNRPLPAEHGGPVRLVVPGWRGINWIKWIERITLISSMAYGELMESADAEHNNPGIVDGMENELRVSSLICSPVQSSVLANGPQLIRGFAWSAGRGIARVDVSLDAGSNWMPAELGVDLGPRSWREFYLPWQATPGHYLLMSRATDLAGNRQAPGDAVQPHLPAGQAEQCLVVSVV